MLFNSFHFLFFFTVVTIAYFAIPYNKRWILLLVSSCYFYMSFVPVYIFILVFTIIIDYFAGILIENSAGRNRKLFLILSLIANIGVLVFFKYYNFLNENIDFILGKMKLSNPLPFSSILLPIGLSFHTFQAMSYTIEVYRGNQKAERHFGIYSLYVMFYPQLVAGPIERPQNLLHQFREKFDFNYDRVTSGLKLMAWGLFKKVVIADRLALVVDSVYSNPKEQNSLTLIIAVIFFSFQILCDFSGYSDIAIGAARVMGFKLMRNFNSPYQSKSVNVFWKRWHISLSTWFKDYLYITLGGNRVSIPRWYLNLFIVFLVSGLWHGANWTFIIWGALHGFFIIFGNISKNFREKTSRFLAIDKIPFLSTITTFLLVSLAWIYFRAGTLSDAFYISTHIFSGLPDLFHKISNHQPVLTNPLLSLKNLSFCICLILLLELVQYIHQKYNLAVIFNMRGLYFRWSFYIAIMLIMVFFGVFEDRQFIYFQF